MNTQFNISDKAEAVLAKAADRIGVAIGEGLEALMKLVGKFHVEHWRGDALIATYDINNAAMTVGLNSLLDVTFRAQSQITAWYAGLVDNASWSAFSAADTMSSHAGWIEWGGAGTKYTVSGNGNNRATWSPGAAAAGSITNSSAMVYDITATGTVKGIFVTSGQSKGGTTGTLWAGALFAADVAVSNGDQLRVTYTLSAT